MATKQTRPLERFENRSGKTVSTSLVHLTCDDSLIPRLLKNVKCCLCDIGSIFGKRDLLAIDHIMLAIFWSYVPNMK